jgi:hypothetical protein
MANRIRRPPTFSPFLARKGSEAHLIGHEFTNPWPQKAAPKSLKPILHVVFWLFNTFDDKCQLEFAIYFNMDILKQCPNSSRESGLALEKRNYFPPRGPRGKVTLLSTSASAITYTAYIYIYIECQTCSDRTYKWPWPINYWAEWFYKKPISPNCRPTSIRPRNENAMFQLKPDKSIRKGFLSPSK